MPDILPTAPQIPTVAETGAPVPAEAVNIGPAGGSSHELHQSDSTGLASSATSYQPAEEEKRRLAATYSQQPVSQDQASQAGSTSVPQRSEKSDKDDELPPYQDN